MLIRDMHEAITEAEITLKKADNVAELLAALLCDRLRRASQTYMGSIYVSRLKRELRSYNIKTRKWKD